MTPTANGDSSPAISTRLTVAICAALLGVFAMLSWLGVRGRSATYDEPMHATAAATIAQFHDHRINPEDPPLWQHWINLSQSQNALRLNSADASFLNTLTDPKTRWEWSVTTLYRTPGNDADAFLMRYRIMLIALAVACGALIGWWAQQLCGAIAAIAAMTLFALDPTFLAHAPMIKNDVAITLVMLLCVYSIWQVGRKFTWRWVVIAVIATATAPAIKFSGVLIPPLAILLLTLRALLPQAWPFSTTALNTRLRRLLIPLLFALCTTLLSIVIIWATYGFRYAPSMTGQFDREPFINDLRLADLRSRHPDKPGITPEEIAKWQMPLSTKVLLWVDDHHLLPQTWTLGLIFTDASARYRDAYMMGQHSSIGFANYFPFAFLVKTPLASVILITAAILLALTHLKKKLSWNAIALAVPVLFYGSLALRSNLNIGIRHILPVFPFLFIVTGWGIAKAWHLGRRTRIAIAATISILAIEIIIAAPNFLCFFNLAAGGSRGGFDLLGDSNLDWGQDLPALAHWQQQNPHRRLYFSYFGTVPPSYYGIRYISLDGTTGPLRDGAVDPSQMPDEPGVIAVSASRLQGLLTTPEQDKALEPLRRTLPTQILNGSIYLFDLTK